MAKKIKTVLKLNIQAGAANPAPPLGPALGQQGVAIMDFVNQYNEATKDRRGEVVPAEVTVYEDRSFTFILKTAPVADLIKQELKIKKGASDSKKKAGEISAAQIKAIAQKKIGDLNTNNIDAAIKIIEGTAKSMGVTIK